MDHTPHDEELTIRVGTKDIYDAIMEVGTRIAVLTESMNGVGERLDRIEETQGDQEQRIRHSERRIARIQYGLPVTLIMGIVGTIATVLLK